MPLSKREYAALIRKQIRQTDDLRAEGRRSAFNLISQMRDRIKAELAQEDLTSFATFRLDRTRRAMAELTNDFARQYGDKLGDLAEKTVDFEREFRKEISDRADVDIQSRLIIPRRNLELAANFRVDLIQKMSTETLNKIVGEISIAAIDPNKGIGDALRGIMGKVVPLRRKDGSTIGALSRAETIAKNETTRLLNITSDAQDKSDTEFLRNRGEEVKKGWQDSGLPNVRPTHAAATARYSIGGSEGPIPVNRAFQVGNDRLMYPQDPSGSPEETINCNCKKFLATQAIVDLAAA